MTRRVATHLTRPRFQFALLAGLLAIAAIATFITFASSSTPSAAQQSHTEFKAVSGTNDTICAIKKADGKIKCWGNLDFQNGAKPTDGGYEAVEVGRNWNCALKADGAASCWGNSSTERPENVGRNNDTGKYHDISLARYHACWVIRDDVTSMNDGKIECEYYHNWATAYGMATVPSDLVSYKFASVITTPFQTCALVEDSDRSISGNQDEGLVKCWNWSVAPTTIIFKSIASGVDHYCGIVEDSNTENTAANEDENSVSCWGDWQEIHRMDRKSDPPVGVTFKSVDGGSAHSCGVVKDNDTSNETADEGADTISCWGSQTDGRIGAPLGTYHQLMVSEKYSCAIALDSDPSQPGNQNRGALACWGDLTTISLTLPEVPAPNLPTATPARVPQRDVVDSISAGTYSTCVKTDAGEVYCTGRNAFGESDPPAGVRVDSLSVGFGHACGISHYGKEIHSNTNVVCWGDDYYGQSTPPEGAFTTVSAGRDSSCGVKADGSVACWGINQPPDYGLISGVPTSAEYVDVRVGFYDASYFEHACALATTGSVSCWGNNAKGQTDVPAGVAFKAIAAGAQTSCGIVLDSDTSNQIDNENEDTARCWGTGYASSQDDYTLHSIKDFPPGAKFKEITTQYSASCGILKENFQDLRVQPLYSVYDRKKDTPYCQGQPSVFSNRAVKYTAGNPQYKYRSYFDEAGIGITYHGFSTSITNSCAIRSDGVAECEGWDQYGETIPQEVVVVPTKAPNDIPNPPVIMCGGDTYNLAPADRGGRFTATAGDYYVSVPAAVLPDTPIIGVRITEGAEAKFTKLGSGHQFSGNVYNVTIKNQDCSDATISATRNVDVCIPKPSARTGRWWDWKLYEIIDNDGTLTVNTTPIQGFTDLGGAVCGEVDKLPIAVAAASKPVPTPTPTPTPTPIGWTPSATPTATPLAVPVIYRIAPAINSVTVSPGDKVRLEVDVYGVQNILDNTLADKHRITFEWSASPHGGSFAEADYAADDDSNADDREILYTASSSPGTYTIKAFVDRMQCGDDDDLDDGCFAEIEVTVRRAAATPEPTVAPMNPAGEIPIFITDYDSNLYEVFTPEEGGNFEGDGVTVVAAPGAVPNLEVIGVRAEVGEEASNVGQTKDRVTLAGSYYDVHAVDDSGQSLKGYLLDDPVTVCIPVPPILASNISQLAMVSERDDGTFAILSSNVRLSSDAGVMICGALSKLSARLAVGQLESPSALPTATPTPPIEEPDTGGNAPPISTSALILLIILGSALGILSLTLMRKGKLSEPGF